MATAGDSLVVYQRWLENNDGADWTTSPTLRSIREYNREDCESTWKLADWLRRVQQKAGIAYVPKAYRSGVGNDQASLGACAICGGDAG